MGRHAPPPIPHNFRGGTDEHIPLIEPSSFRRERRRDRDRDAERDREREHDRQRDMWNGCDPFVLPEGSNKICMDEGDRSVDFTVRDTTKISTMYRKEGFALMWSGGRANIGVKSGKYCFECKVLTNLHVDLPGDTDEETRNHHGCRIGWSVPTTDVVCLGEDEQSFAYCSTGDILTCNTFTKYGEGYGPGDAIGCMIDLDALTISFSKNGKATGEAVKIPENLKGKVFMPHIVIKNTMARFNFHSPSLNESFPPEEYKYIGMAPEEDIEKSPKGPGRIEPEVIVLVGLPGTGKTTWAKKFERDNLGKRYAIISVESILSQMKLDKKNDGQFLQQMSRIASETITELVKAASNQNRNIILDGTNVYQSARRRKLKFFKGFKRIAKVFVTSQETSEQYQEASAQNVKEKDEESKKAEADALISMQSNFELPLVSSVEFDEIDYIGTSEEEAKALVQEFKAKARELEKSKKRDAPDSAENDAEHLSQKLKSGDVVIAPPPGIAAPHQSKEEQQMQEYVAAMAQYQAYYMAQQQMMMQQMQAAAAGVTVPEGSPDTYHKHPMQPHAQTSVPGGIGPEGPPVEQVNPYIEYMQHQNQYF